MKYNETSIHNLAPSACTLNLHTSSNKVGTGDKITIKAPSFMDWRIVSVQRIFVTSASVNSVPATVRGVYDWSFQNSFEFSMVFQFLEATLKPCDFGKLTN